MKLDKLVGDRFKERPAECQIDSHALMIRGGYIKYVANGIYSSYPVLRRVTRKIENIIREEMDAIDGQEVLFPVVLPASLWRESGRYESVGSELLRFRDRNGGDLLLGMTHEEASVQLAREYGGSYARYPFMIYQIQTKFRDEPRPRGGLIRTREFSMKDAYSFHTSAEDLENYFQRCRAAYERIFTRVGIPETIAVKSDSGMMGGGLSYEFILLSPVGEDSVVTCKNCDYRANMEAAECIVTCGNTIPESSLKKEFTPGMKTIADVCEYLGLPRENSCKGVVYEVTNTGKLAVAFIRGDLEINEVKLSNLLGGDIRPAALEPSDGGAVGNCGYGGAAGNGAAAGKSPYGPSGKSLYGPSGEPADALTAGFIGPYRPGGWPDCITVLLDRSLADVKNLCCGANEPDCHYTGFNVARDLGEVQYGDFAKAAENGVCPQCGRPSLTISRGVETGHIFQLGDKYTKSMDMSYLDENGNRRHPLMGCYGIGVSRLAAAICEARHDEYGPIWPVSVAPWHTHLCCVKSGDAEVRAFADDIYTRLLTNNVEAIYDDRNVSAGVMFSDADLIGAPFRVIVSPRNTAAGCCEIISRDKSVNIKVSAADTVTALKKLLQP